MKFEDALLLVKRGTHIASRENWDMTEFIFGQVPSNIEASIIPNMTSLPDIVKKEFTENNITTLRYRHQICRVKASKITYYTPTGDDMYADDWRVKGDDGVYIEDVRDL